MLGQVHRNLPTERGGLCVASDGVVPKRADTAVSIMVNGTRQPRYVLGIFGANIEPPSGRMVINSCQTFGTNRTDLLQPLLWFLPGPAGPSMFDIPELSSEAVRPKNWNGLLYAPISVLPSATGRCHCTYPFPVKETLGVQKRSKASRRTCAISQGSRRSMSLRCNMYKGLPSRNKAMDGDEGG